MRLDIISVMQDGSWTRLSGKSDVYSDREAYKTPPKTVNKPSCLLFHRYPIVFPREKCAGDLEDQPGVRSYGLRPADERYDVYCYADGLKGEKPLPHLYSPNKVVFKCLTPLHI